jgi:hypothetical protein
MKPLGLKPQGFFYILLAHRESGGFTCHAYWVQFLDGIQNKFGPVTNLR